METSVGTPKQGDAALSLAREAEAAPVHPSGGPISPPADAKAAGQLVASAFEPNGGDTERSRAETEERRMSPSLTLIKAPDLQSSQSPEEVLALNAAAIIANIKLQRQLSRRTSVPSETDSSARPQGTSADGQRPDGREPQQQNQPHAAFGPEPWSCSLQEALQRSRPDFITRSQGRLRELERRRLERRELGGSSAGAGRRRVHRGSTCSSSSSSSSQWLVFLMKQKGLDGSKCSRAVAPFNTSAPPTLLLWQMVGGWGGVGGGASVWKKSGGLELLFSAGLEQNTFSFCRQSRSSPPVMRIHFAFAEAVGSDSAEKQQLRDRQRPDEVNQGPAGPRTGPSAGRDLAVAAFPLVSHQPQHLLL
ncbi:hypothetical protein fugu_000459 [Takifugu bimaculatus]|uniref:ALMS motif domain-containing protein n=1 Tax=Takifugu bimaculatus TaxID=433685 RepID=A0A4Z2CH30_9TELE|nr:hypothetical protein fugu_000459 [Takifugu bimaculatus]